ncbi:hypothetical protein PsorP6_001124 [Peronosclerospora sorghi]|uniref:Uncharacterized protein n=1 Tax=Peronosclerospora sorghi TaxID=230839 RepID=A0ACC0WTU0_9STRA|nr:hypothetical protein PsorP6_001124 [Peronosclerospora sorghi]
MAGLEEDLSVSLLEHQQPKKGVSFWKMRVLLIPYFWPKTWGLRCRVFVSFSFMFLSRGSRIIAPLFLKEATNTISESHFQKIPVLSIYMHCGKDFIDRDDCKRNHVHYRDDNRYTIRLRFKKQTNEHDNHASEKAVDSLVNFETVKYFCTEDYELAQYMASIFLYQSRSCLRDAS